MADRNDVWEGGMAAAFRAIQPGESVLQAIERLSGAKSSILLHDAPDDASPILKVGPGDIGDDARYQVVGEIARGGVGVVYKGRDKDLATSTSWTSSATSSRSARSCARS